MFARIVFSFFLCFGLATHVFAVSYPTSTPAGEFAGGAFQTYFDNMYTTTQCNTITQVVGGFTSSGIPICVTPVSSGFFFTGQTSGDTIRFNGTDWIRNNLLYNDGINIGIGTTSPGAKLEVAGQVKITGGGFGSGKFLVSDATGLASWTDIIPATSFSISGQVLGSTMYYDGANWIASTNIFNTGGNVGIGITTPTQKLDINGDALINGIRIGRGQGNILSNSVFGFNVAGSNTTGSNNAVLGSYALSSNVSGSNNVAVGINAGSNLLSGNNNIFIGYNTQPNISNTSSNQLNIGNWIYGSGGNIGIGVLAPNVKLQVGTGSSDTVRLGTIGFNSSPNISIDEYFGVRNNLSDAVGGSAFRVYNTSGQIFAVKSNGKVGIQTDSPANFFTVVGNSSIGSSYSNIIAPSNGLIVEGDVGVGTSSPGAKLEVAGQIKITGGGIGSGKFLVSDANGLASWTDIIPATSFSISGQTLGATTYYDGTRWIGSTNIFNTGGNIGIGTSSPGAKLEVAGQIKITGGSPGSGRILTSDASGLAIWSNGFSGSVTASGITGGNAGYIPYFGTGGNGLLSSFVYYTGSKIGINNTSPTYMVDVLGPSSIIRAGSGFCLGMSASGCVYNWSDLNTVVKSMGTPHYLAKFNSGGFIDNSQIYETGGKLYIGDIPGIISGGATIGYVTIESPGSTNSSNPFLTLSENGGQECRMWITGANKLGSNCSWSAGTSGLGMLPNQVPRADSTGDSLTGGTMYNVGNNVGIGISSPTANLHVSGSTLITGNLTVQGKLFVDSIVNRSVSNITVSGSLLPDSAAPLMYRDIGSATQRWNNLYLSGQIAIAGGSPGSGKILTSDANGLATWSTGFSGSVTASGITGGTQNYVSKFGTGGNGLVISQILDTGTGVVIGGTDVQSKFEVWSGTTSIFHMRGTNNLGLGISSVRTATSGTSNVGIGNNSLRTLTTGYSNSSLGDGSMYNNTTGYFNSALGSQALYSNNGGNWNVGIGSQALWTNLGGGYNVAIGGQALYANSANNNSVAVGYQALRASLADGNIAIGYNAGSGITSGANNIVIGTNVGVPSNTTSNQLNIGNWIYGSGGNIGIGTGINLTSKLVLDSATNNVSGLKFSRINNNSTVYTGAAVGLGVDANGNVVPVSNGDVVVYDAWGRNTGTPSPDPNIASRDISYDFNKYFQLPTKQSFVVSDGNGAGYNAPFFKEDGVSGICSYNGAGGSSPYDCAVADPATGLSASPNNSFTMTARGDNYGYQIALGARGDAPLFARSGKWYNSTTNYGSGLYLSDGVTPTPWQKVLTVPANHIEYFYVNIGYNSQLQAISGGGNIGMGTSTPDMRLVLSYSGTTGSTSRMMRIERGVRGADSNMVTSYGTPYLMIGGKETRTNSIQTIGFGYNTGTSIQPAEIGLLTTNTAGNTLGDLIFATRSTTTNVAPTERMRIGSNGNVAIGTGITTGTAKLKIDGQIQITGGGVSSGRVLVTDGVGLGYWRDVATLGVGGFNYNANSDYSSLNTIAVADDSTDMVFQLADNATDGGDRFVFQQDQWSGDASQRYPLVMNGIYAAFDPRYSLNFNSSTNIYASGSLLSATAYMDYVNRRFGIGTISPTDTLHVNGTFRLVDGTQGAGKVLTSDGNGVASWQTPSGGGGVSAYKTNLTSAASTTSNTFVDAGLTSTSLPAGYYNFRSTIKFRTAATTTGIGIGLVSNGATVANYAGQLQAQSTASALQVYSNGTLGSTTLVSTAVPAANTDYIATFNGIFQVTSAGSVKLQFRSEVNGSNVTIQPGSNFIIEPL